MALNNTQFLILAGKPDALRSLLKHAETHLATMVHAAWDLMLSAPSKKPSLSLNTSEANEATDNSNTCETNATQTRYTAERDRDSDSGGSSSDWYDDQPSSREHSDVDQFDDGEEKAETGLKTRDRSADEQGDAAHAPSEEERGTDASLSALSPGSDYACF